MLAPDVKAFLILVMLAFNELGLKSSKKTILLNDHVPRDKRNVCSVASHELHKPFILGPRFAEGEKRAFFHFVLFFVAQPIAHEPRDQSSVPVPCLCRIQHSDNKAMMTCFSKIHPVGSGTNLHNLNFVTSMIFKMTLLLQRFSVVATMV